MNFKHFIYAMAVMALVFNCSNSSEEDLVDTPPEENDKITYTANIKPIIDSNCSSCHGNPPTNGAPISWTTYQNVSNNAANILSRISRQTGEAGAMPVGGPRLPQASIDLFQEWINDGLLEN